MEPVKIAILGGGMGALSTAWRLVQEPGAAERYDITVYQRGGRLGGKGASGRNPDPKLGARIEEHGLHILMGFYDHAFRVLRSCYEDLETRPAADRACRVLPWKKALTPCDEIVLGERLPGDAWGFWKIPFPTREGEPGTDLDHPSPLELFRRAIDWFRQLHTHFWEAIDEGKPAVRFDPFGMLHDLKAIAEAQLRNFAADVEWLERLIETARDKAMTRLHDDAIRHLFIALNFIAVNLRGMIHEGLVFASDEELLAAVQRLDAKDYRDWLRENEIMPVPENLSVRSPLVNALYDLIFADSATFAAGTCLYDTLQMLLTYKGHLYYKMNAGMGDIVFAPLYLYLEQRNVKFRFFTRVTGLELEGTQSIRAISIEEQVPGMDGYDPLVCIKDIPCWPSEPPLDRMPRAYQDARRARGEPFDLESLEASPFGRPGRLTIGKDFDVVVLGISVGGLAPICPELMQADGNFRRMVQELRTMRTRAVQIWLDATIEELGWGKDSPVLGSYAREFNAWSDMSQVLPAETWAEPKSVAYFCDTILDDEASNAGARARVKQDFLAWVDARIRSLWPNFSWDRVVDPDGRAGNKRFDTQYVRANVDGSDHYVLSVRGSSQHRLESGKSGFDNLFLAGDWVRTRLNAGCLEAATMGGLAAGEAIVTRTPTLLAQASQEDEHAPQS